MFIATSMLKEFVEFVRRFVMTIQAIGGKKKRILIKISAHLTGQVLVPAPRLLQRCPLNPRTSARTKTGGANTAGAAE